MATYFTVGDCYSRVSAVLLEPWLGGLGPGLSLGIITEAQFLEIFGTVLLDFLNRTSLIWGVFTQQTQFGTAQYLYPTDISTAKAAFLGGVWLEHVSMNDLDNWNYVWRSATGIPDFWHEDGLPPKTVEMAVTPNYTGSGYLMTVGADPPYGIYGKLNGAPIGRYSGTLTTSGTAVTWVSGDLFNVDWANYSPFLNMTIAGTDYPVAAVADITNLTLDASAGTQPAVAWSLNVTDDGNLSILGPSSISSTTFTLGEVIPVVPDALAYFLAYGILGKIFSMDGESRDPQRATWCLARYQEGINLASAVSGGLANWAISR